MQWAALVAWLLTAFGGATMLVQWLRHGGAGQNEGIRRAEVARPRHPRRPRPGVLDCLSRLRRGPVLAWAAVGQLLVVGLIGATMFASWIGGRSSRDHTAVPAETGFPLPIVLGHGVLALATVDAGRPRGRPHRHVDP